MARSRHEEILSLFENMKAEIHVPNHLEYQAAVRSLRSQLESIVNDECGKELLNRGALSFSALKTAIDAPGDITLKEAEDIVEEYGKIVSYYRDNHESLSLIIGQPWFISKIKETSDVMVWGELLKQEHLNLRLKNPRQTTTHVVDALSRMHTPAVVRKEEPAAIVIVEVKQVDSKEALSAAPDSAALEKMEKLDKKDTKHHRHRHHHHHRSKEKKEEKKVVEEAEIKIQASM